MIDQSPERRDVTLPPADPIPPNGGRLVRRIASPEEADAIRSRAGSLESIEVPQRILFDLDLIAIGALSPLEGFMTACEIEEVLETLRLPGGAFLGLPVLLPIAGETAGRLRAGGEAALRGADGALLGVMELRDLSRLDLEGAAERIFATADAAHPGAAALLSAPPWIAGGPVLLLDRPRTHPFRDHDLEPRQTRALFRERGWRSIVAFQTRNPIHRAHEYLQKSALEIIDGLLIHPLVGETKADDIPAEVRMRCYETLIEHYYPKERTLLSVLPAAMRYAGPREAVFHAILRRNYGCTHFIVGRDHAGVGSYYGPYEAQELLRSLPPGDLGIVPLCFDDSFYCTRCAGMASRRTCPHPEEERVSLSGTRVRELLRSGEPPPPEFTRPEVARVLMEMYARSRAVTAIETDATEQGRD